jgi:hypothetical protein
VVDELGLRFAEGREEVNVLPLLVCIEDRSRVGIGRLCLRVARACSDTAGWYGIKISG